MLIKVKTAYEHIDDKIMVSSNSVMKAFNILTGRTKKDLANLLLTFSPVLETPGFLNSDPVSIMLLPISYIFSYFQQKKNIEIDALERRGLERKIYEPEVEFVNCNAKFFGPVFIATSAPSFFKPHNNGNFIRQTQLFDYGVGLGFILAGLSFYIMRTDPLLPRKSLIKEYIEYFNNKREFEQKTV